MIESSWLRALEIGERPQLQDTVRGRGSFLAAHNLAVLHDGLGADGRGARTGASARRRDARPPRLSARMLDGAASALHFRPSAAAVAAYACA